MKNFFTQGIFAGSPGYYPSSAIESSSSSGFVCDVIRDIISRLSQASLEALKEYIRNRLRGRSADDEPNYLVEALAFLSSNPNVTEKDRSLFETLLNLQRIEYRTDWGFDFDSAWECLKEIFRDLWDEIVSSSESSSLSSSES